MAGTPASAKKLSNARASDSNNKTNNKSRGTSRPPQAGTSGVGNNTLNCSSVEQAYERGTPLGRGAYGATRLCSLEGGAEVVIKQFRLDVENDVRRNIDQLRVIAEAMGLPHSRYERKTDSNYVKSAKRLCEHEVAMHNYIWSIDKMRPFITKPIATSCTTMSVQHHAAAENQVAVRLRDWLRKWKFDYTEGTLLLSWIKKAVYIMQDHNVLHRDMHDENILVILDKNAPRRLVGVKIIDWGIAEDLSGMHGHENPINGVLAPSHYNNNTNWIGPTNYNSHICRLRKKMVPGNMEFRGCSNSRPPNSKRQKRG